jgi:hypothetical protein
MCKSGDLPKSEIDTNEAFQTPDLQIGALQNQGLASGDRKASLASLASIVLRIMTLQ